ncbi:protein far1-related sequence 5-like [Gigaspora margarita]|uniref:Protein far1-related sequence 5-like n=1 Tax=Gigaspora margarita TaxID=4874 RepID=A0A8H4ASN3_GIGMA|nr:protein far1-related sequence 5-like [Gigaspora margarita]
MKLRGRPLNKRIKLASETNLGHVNSKHSAINPLDLNLYVQQQNPQVASSRTPFSVLNSNDLEENTCAPSDDIYVKMQPAEDNIPKRKYICKACGQPGHNAKNKLKCGNNNNA